MPNIPAAPVTPPAASPTPKPTLRERLVKIERELALVSAVLVGGLEGASTILPPSAVRDIIQTILPILLIASRPLGLKKAGT